MRGYLKRLSRNHLRRNGGKSDEKSIFNRRFTAQMFSALSAVFCFSAALSLALCSFGCSFCCRSFSVKEFYRQTAAGYSNTYNGCVCVRVRHNYLFISLSFLKPWPNDRNISTQHYVCHPVVTCRDMLGV